MLPNFLVTGSPKSGRTVIWHYLNEHQDILMSPNKETKIFGLRHDKSISR